MRVFVVDLGFRRLSVRIAALLCVTTLFVSSAFGIIMKKHADVLLPTLSDGGGETVIIDAGHGGEDSGAIGKNGALEKDINLSVSVMLGEELTARGYNVVYTRTEDKLLYKEEENIKGIRKISDLKNRCAIAKEYPKAIFVSIHVNSFGDPRYSGLQVYFSENDARSRQLADKIQLSVKDRLQPDNSRKIKPGKALYILEHIDNVAVLVECGFISNLEEAEKLSDKEYQKELSFAIVCGIIEYIKT